MENLDNKASQTPMFHHPLEKGDVVQLCAGMPEIGTREFLPEEQDYIDDLRREFLRGSLMRGALALFILGAAAYLLYTLFNRADSVLWYDILVGALAIAGLGFGLFSLIQPVDFLLRGWVLRRAGASGYVRVFKGTLNPSDFTDKSRRWLEKTGLLDEDSEAFNTIELYANHNIVHSINDEMPDEWLAVILTRAAAVPAEPLVLDVPTDWFPEAAEGAMQRRRQTLTEHEEILAYAQMGRKRLNLIPFVWGVPMFLALVFLMYTLLQLDPALVAWVSGAIAGAITIYNLLHTRRKINALLEDAEYGWVIIFTPEKLLEPGEDDRLEGNAPTEFLPASETLWSFGGKPAAWRYGATSRPRP
jgi:hypothetical protein